MNTMRALQQKHPPASYELRRCPHLVDLAGPAYSRSCGAAVAAQDKTDLTQEVQTLSRTAPLAGCDLYLCKGYQFEDVKPEAVQRYKIGQSIDFVYDLTIPHPGNDPTNITIIDVKSRAVISKELFSSPSLGTLVRNISLPILIPALSNTTACKTAGECVLALNWDAKDINQTFRMFADKYILTIESCVDFVLM
ncbi:hypothetical protein MRB53_040827 [Persea americana]|nr:hypothetical protein MRB53_040827 [Persea americana]